MLPKTFAKIFDERFNRYMVECESGIGCNLELITLVLIDTWWNVNKKGHRLYSLCLSFNRYMVECEYVHKKESDDMRKSF